MVFASYQIILIFVRIVVHLLQSSIEKKGLYILPQYLGNLTQAIRHKGSNIYPCNDMVHAKFEDFRTCLYVFMSVSKVFVCYESVTGNYSNHHPFFLHRIARQKKNLLCIWHVN